MTNSVLVDGLGMFAGAVWMSGALYFQFIRNGRVHPGYVGAQFLIGVALLLGSSAFVISGRTALVQLLAIGGYVLFMLIGLGAWYELDKYADREEQKSLDAHADSHDSHLKNS